MAVPGSDQDEEVVQPPHVGGSLPGVGAPLQQQGHINVHELDSATRVAARVGHEPFTGGGGIQKTSSPTDGATAGWVVGIEISTHHLAEPRGVCNRPTAVASQAYCGST